MRGNFGEHFRLTLFGESHGGGIGVVIDGVPAGTPIDEAYLASQMRRRAPGNDPTATSRKEADQVRLVSGVLNGFAEGTPILCLIENTNTHSKDYSELAAKMRPGHADYAARIKYRGYNDVRGGGPFSGRLTAPLVAAGSIARQMLSSRGISIASHIAAIGPVLDTPFSRLDIDSALLERLSSSPFPLIDPSREGPMREAVEAARQSLDSVGGCIECTATGVPAGIGSPFFGSVESIFSHLAFSVPAVKAVEFGDGRDIAAMRGSQANDQMAFTSGRVTCLTNHNGGITGGITNGMPILIRTSIKPTPSIGQIQQTVDMVRRENAALAITGRHDPCIVPRACVVMESILAITLCELIMDDSAQHPFAKEQEQL